MKKAEYLNDPHVRSFLDWAVPLAEGTRPLRHGWQSPSLGSWSCETLFGAYRKYDWPFWRVLPGDLVRRRHSSYGDTVAVLDALSQQLRESAEEKNATRFLEAAVAVVQWGGVRQNERRLRALGEDALPRLTAAARLLDPAEADLRRLSDVRPMTSGFSKIYSLLVDGFPIYDSRVACALASLVRLFCEETRRTEVPAQLRLALPPSQGKVRRDPTCGQLVFPRIWTPGRYAQSNVMAAWLLDALAATPPFSELGADRLRAVQFAMFMIGYTVYSEPKAASQVESGGRQVSGG